jgi:hypothetical protein
VEYSLFQIAFVSEVFDVSSYDTASTSLGLASSSVPEPSTFALAGLGGIGLMIGAYRRRRAAAV